MWSPYQQRKPKSIHKPIFVVSNVNLIANFMHWNASCMLDIICDRFRMFFSNQKIERSNLKNFINDRIILFFFFLDKTIIFENAICNSFGTII